MATFSAVNVPAPLAGGSNGVLDREHTSTVSRASAGTVATDLRSDESSPNTPTRHSFGGVLGQRPLPDGPLTPAKRVDEGQDSSNPSQSRVLMGDGTSQSAADMEDVEMEDGEDDDMGSGNESMTSDTHRPAKKKKGQRFFCTDYPPCQLSFTRSEHLARHIRKHTGERPFQCHCSRRFSRLDNLRQHAQTVHVNEEIPGDSLAAQSTRFQRQIRTDKVRPTSSRSRASTAGSQGGHSRGHSRNLSTSSIGSTTSSVGPPDEGRRRPQPLAMANDTSARSRPPVETVSSSSSSNSSKVATTAGPQFAYYKPSPSGYSTPTSAAFSTGNVSPQHPPAVVSPSSTISRSSFYNGNRTHARRLSVPSTQKPQQYPGGTYPPPFLSPMTPTSNAPFSPTSQVFTSPTSSVFSHSRRDSESEMDYRRRTWHPSTNPFFMQRPATSGLTYHQTPDEPRPAFTQQPAASQMTRLPGIESFDHAPPPASRQQPPSPMMVDVAPRPPSSGRPSDVGLQQGLTRLDIAAANAGEDKLQARRHAPSAQRFQFVHANLDNNFQFPPPQRMSMPEQPVTSRKAKRNAWYGGPVGPITSAQASQVAVKASPEESGISDGVVTPSTVRHSGFRPSAVNIDVGPEGYTSAPVLSQEQNVYQSSTGQPQKMTPVRADSGFHGPPPQDQLQQQPISIQQTYALQSGHDPRLGRSHYHPPPSSDMTKLEALVAVAASQNRAVEHTT